MNRLARLIKHPTTQIVISLVLIVTSLAEGGKTFIEDLTKFDMGVHHGVLVFGIASLLKGLSDAHEARKRLAAARRQES